MFVRQRACGCNRVDFYEDGQRITETEYCSDHKKQLLAMKEELEKLDAEIADLETKRRILTERRIEKFIAAMHLKRQH